MIETIVSGNALPETLLRMLPKGRVKVRQEKGVVTVIPLQPRKESPLRGMLGEGKLSTARLLQQKAADLELEP